MTAKTTFTSEEACSIGEQIGVDWATAPFDVEQFRMGIDVELEHGLHDPQTDVTGSDPIDWQDRARTSEGVPRLLHAAQEDGAGGGAGFTGREVASRDRTNVLVNCRKRASWHVRQEVPGLGRLSSSAKPGNLRR